VTAALDDSPATLLERLRDDWFASLGSPETERTYRFVFGEYVDWCATVDVDPSTPTRGDIDRYRRWLRNPHRARGVCSTVTVAKKLSALSSFFRYAIDDDLSPIAVSPVRRVDRPRVANVSHSEGLTASEARAFLAVSTASDEPMHAALAHLLLSTGMRVSEACTADVGSLGRDGDARIVTVVRKGSEKHRLPLSTTCCAALDRYLAPRQAPKDAPLLVTRRGRLSRSEAYRIVARLAAEAGVRGAVGPHRLRHTAATMAIQAGAPLWRVQEMLGHSDLRTTMRYFHAVDSLGESAVHVLDRALTGDGGEA
jgi:site-specific recombinase XerD